MEQFRIKRIIFFLVFGLFYGFFVKAQKAESVILEDSIFCVELDIEIEDFEVVQPTIIRVCCGGPFQDNIVPCKIISKASYESFTGQSDEVFLGINHGIFVHQLVQSKKDKLVKIKQIEVINSSTITIENNLLITVRKGLYAIDEEGKIYLELEFLK